MNGVQKTRNQWILAHKGQVVAVVAQILWCMNTEDSINNIVNTPEALSEWFSTSVIQLNMLSAMVRGDLSSLERKIIVALITTEVHNRDVVDRLVQNECESVFSFDWQQQLRYYLENDLENCIIRQVTARC
jgi:dynein heavy chain